MSNEFMREERYIVFKISDIKEALSASEIDDLKYLHRVTNACRERLRKKPLECVVVEKDWPEYEPTWKAIEARVTGAQPSPSFADAYQGAMEEVAIWKKRALEAEDVNRKFIADINGPTHMGEPAQNAASINEGVRKVTLDFRWESEAQHHIPTIEIEFDPVSPGSPNDAKSWQDRDRLAAMLTPEAKP